MLTLILGRAGTGKTTHVMDEIKKRIERGETGLYLLVPEQYSHDAERQLCAVCGDKLSLHGEALSFTRLCSRVFAETGGTAAALDAGGLILVMRRALDTVAPGLRVFANRGVKAEFLEKLHAAVREFKTLSISPAQLEEMSVLAPSGPLADKLHDLSLIMGAFDSFFGPNAADPASRLDKLADNIGKSSVGNTGHIYFDGFNDFTVQETRVIEALMKKNAELTCCLTCGQSGGEEIFAITRKTVGLLKKLAEKYAIETKIVYRVEQSSRADSLKFLERQLFEHSAERYDGDSGAVSIYRAPTIYAECETAAHLVLKLVRSGYRWRDIGIMPRDMREYGPVCENVFEKYGIKFFTGGKADILQKPPVALIDAALEIAVSGWEYGAVFRYLKTGFCGISHEDCAELENYVIKWNIRGAMWARSGDWTLPPSGYGGSVQKESETLARINECRRKITEPLVRLHEGIRGISDASEKLETLCAFLDEIGLPQSLEMKAAEFDMRGEHRLADEYVQLWDIIKNAMEQFYTILGEVRIDAAEFRRLFALVLSQYGVGVIPVALDRAALGDMAMSRRRDLKCLIILGASDGNLPKLKPESGVFSLAERSEMIKLGADIPAGHEDRLCREMNMIYSVLTLPTERLILTYNTEDGGRPSFIVKRIKAILGVSETVLREDEYMVSSINTCVELASFPGEKGAAARVFCRDHLAEDAARIESYGKFIADRRVNLTRGTAQSLYGQRIVLTASRVEKFYSCAFAHFLQNGLKLAPRVPAGFDAPQAGTFTHYVLENVSSEIRKSGGFKNADENRIRELTRRYIDEYVRVKLFGFEGKNERFRYLFNRLAGDTERVVLDMAAELCRSDFLPLNFELDLEEFAQGQSGYNLFGIADRIDGWRHNGKLYLRVVDYKTGKKPFLLSDVYRGMGMQMLIYLFTLARHGGAYYGSDIEPAGVLYVPARDVIVKAPRSATESQIKILREKELRRGGLILSDPAVLDAMENGDEKIYLPVKPKGGGDGVANEKQFLLLAEHVDKMLKYASDEILSGGISCQPYYKDSNDNACLYCEYRAACGFSEDLGDKRRYFSKMKSDEFWKAISGEVTEDE